MVGIIASVVVTSLTDIINEWLRQSLFIFSPNAEGIALDGCSINREAHFLRLMSHDGNVIAVVHGL
ncbi:hypothetical protein [Candidatus Symbiopectobacterium sp. NZEC135]|uniref:hypothetical protein n=1 Tax=Candidatus Symbiopectobacterium sp. NZEC135 TaxID=2820471 RepID=UPI002227184A|nr:hypothetical protein [Candidatus Symbiopectobacterium sp. NZEC135]MCW2478883.1 hypothetical protein [Candidatus Symbiopectobacterium sp. NZEC135]